MACDCGCCGTHKGHGFFGSQKWEYIKLIVSFVLLVVAFFWEDIVGHSWGMYLNPSWFAIIVCGWPIVEGAWHGLAHEKKIKTSLLITIAIVASIALEVVVWCGVTIDGDHSHGYLFAAGEIAFLMALGEFLEDVTVKRTRVGIEKLVNLSPRTATVKLFGQLLVMEVSEIQPGDIVVVKPNDMIPVDGEIILGETAVDQSSITGESVPVDKKVGDVVYAGTWNKSGALEVRVTKKSNETTVAKLVSLVEEAEGTKAPISRLADRWASYIVPMAITLGFGVCLLTKLFAGIGWVDAAVRGVTIFVVFCPCALALATPTAIAAALGALANRGIMAKSGKAIEELAKIDTVCFDKTGTITTGNLAVEDCWCEDIDQNEFLALLGGAENNSEHPIAQAIVKYAQDKTQLATPKTTNALVGVGLEAEFENNKMLIAQWKQFENETGIVCDKANEMLAKGLTVMGVKIDDKLVGVIAVSDTIREDSPYAVGEINKNCNTVMLTGDNESAAKRMATLAGVKEVKYQLLPDQKLEYIKNKQQAGGKVCMIGDGVNDAPSLALADCSIAMGAFGSDLAIETADVALMTNDVARLPGLLRFAKKVLRTIKFNIILAMSINLAAVVLSAFGILGPVMGALLHNCTSVLVIGNSALLLLDKDKGYKQYKANK